MTSNQHYRGINKRFEKRAALLRRVGYAYTVNEFGAFFVRTRYAKTKTVPACFLSLADKRTWGDKLATLLNR